MTCSCYSTKTLEEKWDFLLALQVIFTTILWRHYLCAEMIVQHLSCCLNCRYPYVFNLFSHVAKWDEAAVNKIKLNACFRNAACCPDFGLSKAAIAINQAPNSAITDTMTSNIHPG